MDQRLSHRYQVTITADGAVRPFAITRREAARVIGSIKLLQRMIHTASDPAPEKRWVEYARRGGPGSETLLVAASIEGACMRLLAGEAPPLLPGEAKRKQDALSA